MIELEQWKARLGEMQAEHKFYEMHAFACECLRLSLPLLEQPTRVSKLLHIAQRYVDSLVAVPSGLSYDDYNSLRESKGLMTDQERSQAIASGSSMTRLATRIDWAHTFALVAVNQLSALLEAHLKAKLGSPDPVVPVVERIGRLFLKNGEQASLLYKDFPNAAHLLEGLLEGTSKSKTVDRLKVFRSFTIHGSFRHVAAEQSRENGVQDEPPDHHGPAYNVRKLGESLGIQLTCLATGPGRSRTEMTPAGHALADWIGCRPDLFA